MWAGPALIALVLLAELVLLFARNARETTHTTMIGSAAVGTVLFGPYLLGVELASMLLLAGLVGAYHLGRHATAGEIEKGE